MTIEGWRKAEEHIEAEVFVLSEKPERRGGIFAELKASVGKLRAGKAERCLRAPSQGSKVNAHECSRLQRIRVLFAFFGRWRRCSLGAENALSTLWLPRVKHGTHLLGRPQKPMVIKDLWPTDGDAN